MKAQMMKCKSLIALFQIAGPIWSDPLFDPEFIDCLLADAQSCEADKRLATHDRIVGMLTVAREVAFSKKYT